VLASPFSPSAWNYVFPCVGFFISHISNYADLVYLTFAYFAPWLWLVTSCEGGRSRSFVRTAPRIADKVVRANCHHGAEARLSCARRNAEEADPHGSWAGDGPKPEVTVRSEEMFGLRIGSAKDFFTDQQKLSATSHRRNRTGQTRDLQGVVSEKSTGFERVQGFVQEGTVKHVHFIGHRSRCKRANRGRRARRPT